MKIVTNKFKRLFNAFWAIPAVLVMRLMKPFILVRICSLFSERIGHFVADSVHHYLRNKELPKKIKHLYWFYKPTSNSQWDKILKRNLPIYQFVENIDYWNKKIPGGKSHILNTSLFLHSRDINGIIEKSFKGFDFLKEEEKEAKRWLTNQGWKEGEPFVCLLVRDKAYLESAKHLNAYKQDWDHHNYRNSDISSFEPSIEWLVKQGVWVIRMGKKVSKPLNCKGKRIIDYPFDKNISDLLDIWLFSNCSLCISTLAGADFISDVYRRPLLLINFLPLADLLSWSNSMHVPKNLIWKDSGEELSLKEHFKHSYHHDKEYKEAGIIIEDLTKDEILESVIECWEQIKEDKTLCKDAHKQELFWKTLFNPEVISGPYPYILKEQHKWKHPSARMGEYWIENRSKYFFQNKE